MFTKIYDWFVWSSTDAEKLSLTIKGFATFIPTLVILLGLFHIQVAPGSIQAIIDGVVTLITAFVAFITALVTVIGIVIKVINTLRGTNDLLNKYYPPQNPAQS